MWHKAFESDEVNNIIQALGIRFGVDEESKVANIENCVTTRSSSWPMPMSTVSTSPPSS